MSTSNTLKLDQFLKLSQVVSTGGQAKILIQSGEVWVNDVLETRRGRKLRPGDRVRVGDRLLVVEERDWQHYGVPGFDPHESVSDSLR